MRSPALKLASRILKYSGVLVITSGQVECKDQDHGSADLELPGWTLDEFQKAVQDGAFLQQTVLAAEMQEADPHPTATQFVTRKYELARSPVGALG